MLSTADGMTIDLVPGLRAMSAASPVRVIVSTVVVTRGHELKLVYPQPTAQPEQFEGLGFEEFLLQPMDGPAREANTAAAVAYCLAHPRWRLSLQTHKMLGIP